MLNGSMKRVEKYYKKWLLIIIGGLSTEEKDQKRECERNR